MGDRARWLKPFLAGLVAGGGGLVLAQGLFDTRRRSPIDPRVWRHHRREGHHPAPVVIVPGIMGSGLLRPDGTPVWLNLRNAVGYYDLGLPLSVPLSASRDELRPGALLGTDGRLARMFGFTEYADLLDVLDSVGFRGVGTSSNGHPVRHVCSYDWRRDLVESARRLDEVLEALAQALGEPDARFNVVGHSMGGLVARYYLRYGTAEPSPTAPVTWAGAARIRNLVLVAAPNAGGIPALEGLLSGVRVGLSYTTLAAGVIARMPSVHQLLPDRTSHSLLDHALRPLDADPHQLATWERFGWGPFAPPATRRLAGYSERETEAGRAFLGAALARAAAFRAALDRTPESRCPVRVLLLGGDCLPTIARAVVPERPGLLPRFEPLNQRETDAMLEPGDGRVTRSSLLSSHRAPDGDELACGVAEASHVFVGAADHHGIYREPSFQGILLRLLLRGERRLEAPAAVH